MAERDAIICWRTALCITILKPPNADSYLWSPPLTNEETNVKKVIDLPKNTLLLILDPCLKSGLIEYIEHRWALDSEEPGFSTNLLPPSMNSRTGQIWLEIPEILEASHFTSLNLRFDESKILLLLPKIVGYIKR